MKQIEQTILAPPTGNCFSACVASIFELRLECVPQPTAEEGGNGIEGWMKFVARFHEEFLYPRNLYMTTLVVSTDWKPKGYCLLAAQSPRFDGLHSVVCLDGEIVFDPHPERAMGVGEWREWDVFFVLDPSLAINHRI